MCSKIKAHNRHKHIKLKNARSHKPSSQQWLSRQLNDPYVQQAKACGYRARSALKLKEIDQKYKVFKRGQSIIDLGCSPGGWCQVAMERIHCAKMSGAIFGIDLLPMIPVPGVSFVQGDFTDNNTLANFRGLLPDTVDVVISDMASATTGHAKTDHLRTIALAEAAYEFAQAVLKVNGAFITKVFQGGTDGQLLTNLKRHFKNVDHFKPPASRKQSPEMYVIARGFSG